MVTNAIGLCSAGLKRMDLWSHHLLVRASAHGSCRTYHFPRGYDSVFVGPARDAPRNLNAGVRTAPLGLGSGKSLTEHFESASPLKSGRRHLGYLLPGTTDSGLPSCFEHCRFKRLARCRPGRHHKLKCRVVALTCVEGSGQEHLALSMRRVRAT